MVEAFKGILYPDVSVTAKVPEVVIGEPETVKPVGTVIATDETVPIPNVDVAVKV